ncbi:MAG TPA: hypothetical protein VGI24_03845 [Solirubrobacteraceae bacterium]|jgi:hypothetical protein
MGLLDDAIREHLELKRLRGADPGMVSREESEVFGAAPSQEPGAGDDDIGAQQSPAHEYTSHFGSELEEPSGFSNVGQETAEIDMRTVLENQPGAEPGSAEPAAARPRSSEVAEEQPAGNDSLEWEMPGEGAAEESHEAEPRAAETQGEEPVEDVLEETPDFLRDTPEQERLWFEQRPPRDFDFEK